MRRRVAGIDHTKIIWALIGVLIAIVLFLLALGLLGVPLAIAFLTETMHGFQKVALAIILITLVLLASTSSLTFIGALVTSYTNRDQNSGTVNTPNTSLKDKSVPICP